MTFLKLVLNFFLGFSDGTFGWAESNRVTLICVSITSLTSLQAGCGDVVQIVSNL